MIKEMKNTIHKYQETGVDKCFEVKNVITYHNIYNIVTVNSKCDLILKTKI